MQRETFSKLRPNSLRRIQAVNHNAGAHHIVIPVKLQNARAVVKMFHREKNSARRKHRKKAVKFGALLEGQCFIRFIRRRK